MAEQLRRAQRKYQTPLAYEVGKDVPQERYEEILVAVADWFREWRTTVEPTADARARLRCCLDGKKMSGEPWFTAWNSTFAARVRMLCRYDIDKMQAIRKGDEKRRQKKQQVRERENARRRADIGANDEHIPELTRKELDGRVKYGDKALPVTEAELALWEKTRDAYLEQFPELRTINAKGELSFLCDMHVVQERNRLKFLTADKGFDPHLASENTKQIAELKRALGIHPDQLAKRVKDTKEGSLADAVARFETMPPALRDKFLAEELLILWQQYHTPSPRGEGDGYQLDEVGLFGATRCATCACAKCGQRNYRGLPIDQIEAWLQHRGDLTLEEDLPKIEVVPSSSGVALYARTPDPIDPAAVTELDEQPDIEAE